MTTFRIKKKLQLDRSIFDISMTYEKNPFLRDTIDTIVHRMNYESSRLLRAHGLTETFKHAGFSMEAWRG